MVVKQYKTCPECPHCPTCKTTIKAVKVYDPSLRWVAVCRQHGEVNGPFTCVYTPTQRRQMRVAQKAVDRQYLPKRRSQTLLPVIATQHLDGQGLQQQQCRACGEEIRYVPLKGRFIDQAMQTDCPKRGYRGHKPCNYYYACCECGVLTLTYDGRVNKHVCGDGVMREALNITLGSAFVRVPVPMGV